MQGTRKVTRLFVANFNNALYEGVAAFVACSTEFCTNFVLQATNAQGLGTRLKKVGVGSLVVSPPSQLLLLAIRVIEGVV